MDETTKIRPASLELGDLDTEFSALAQSLNFDPEQAEAEREDPAGRAGELQP